MWSSVVLQLPPQVLRVSVQDILPQNTNLALWRHASSVGCNRNHLMYWISVLLHYISGEQHQARCCPRSDSEWNPTTPLWLEIVLLTCTATSPTPFLPTLPTLTPAPTWCYGTLTSESFTLRSSQSAMRHEEAHCLKVNQYTPDIPTVPHCSVTCVCTLLLCVYILQEREKREREPRHCHTVPWFFESWDTANLTLIIIIMY